MKNGTYIPGLQVQRLLVLLPSHPTSCSLLIREVANCLDDLLISSVHYTRSRALTSFNIERFDYIMTNNKKRLQFDMSNTSANVDLCMISIYQCHASCIMAGHDLLYDKACARVVGTSESSLLSTPSTACLLTMKQAEHQNVCHQISDLWSQPFCAFGDPICRYVGSPSRHKLYARAVSSIFRAISRSKTVFELGRCYLLLNSTAYFHHGSRVTHSRRRKDAY